MATTFSVGDRVRIRDWDDMASEFGVDEDGEIPCKYIFAQSMRDFCGQEYTISTTRNNPDGTLCANIFSQARMCLLKASEISCKSAI